LVLHPALQIGPRMELEIVKAEEGMCTGEVLYHQHINKSKAEVAEKSKEIQDREELREKRRRQQARPSWCHTYISMSAEIDFRFYEQ
jgi:hypothetical protein